MDDSLDPHLLHPTPTEYDVKVGLFADHDRMFLGLAPDGDRELTEVDESGIAVGSHGRLRGGRGTVDGSDKPCTTT